MTNRDPKPVRRFLLIALTAATLITFSVSLTAAQEPPPNFIVHEFPKSLPKVAFRDGDEGEVSLADFQGKVILLNIWATWCVPCRREMPTLDRLQVQLGGPGFEVVALSIDRKGAGAVRSFYSEVSIQNLAIYIDSGGKSARALGMIGLPTTLLIDQDGKEIGRLIGPFEWDTPEIVAFLRSRVPEKSGALVPAELIMPITPTTAPAKHHRNARADEVPQDAPKKPKIHNPIDTRPTPSSEFIWEAKS